MSFGDTPNIIKLDKQLATQPEEVIFCKRCVISNQRFRIQIGEDGVCSACKFRIYEQTQVNWVDRAKELEDLAGSLRWRKGIHAIVAVSGGKDSSWIAHTLKHELGLNILCVCFAPFMRTEIGQQNYDAFIDSGYRVLEGHPNGRFHRRLARLCFDSLGDAWQPFGMAQMAYPHWVALQLGVPAIFYAENGEGAYTGDIDVFNLRGMPSSEWATRYHKGMTIDDLVTFGLNEQRRYFSDTEFNVSDLEWYRPPSEDALRKAGTQMYWLGYFKQNDPMENYYAATRNTGFKPNPERSEGSYTKYASLDDKTDGFHFFLGYIKMGLGRATSDAAHEVRDGQLTREEGIALVKRYDGEFPKRYFRGFLDYLDISEAHFWDVIDQWRAPHLWTQGPNGWELKHQVS